MPTEADRTVQAEVQHRGQRADGGVVALDLRIAVEHLAEHGEVRLAVGLGVLQHGRRDALPELRVDVLGRVQPVAVDVEVVDPEVEDVDEPVDHVDLLGEEVVETEEVTVLRALAGEGRVAAVVVVGGSFSQAGFLAFCVRRPESSACRGS